MTFEYEVAISFAGEQRPEAEAIASCLQNMGITVFYDGYEKANLWGETFTNTFLRFIRKERVIV
jgi:hypothetical protein